MQQEQKYTRQLLCEFHETNHTFIVNKETRNRFVNYIELPFDNYYINTDCNKYYNLNTGFYYTIIGIRNYFFVIDDAISGDDYLVIYNDKKAYIMRNGHKQYILLNMDIPFYPMNIVNGESLLENTVNASLNNIIIGGKTDIEYPDGIDSLTPYHPSKINSISDITIDTYNSSDTKKDSMIIKLKNNIKRLPNGTMDTLNINCTTCRATIIFRVGRLILTGNEDWVVYDDGYNKDYCIYFLKYNAAAVGTDDTGLLCNYYPTISCHEMLHDDTIQYAISNNNDSKNTGFYFRVPKDVVTPDKDGDNFKAYLNDCLKTNPVIVEFLLKEPRHKSVLLDEYHLKSFYPNTNVKINHNTATAIGYKSFGEFTETRYKNTTALETEL